MGMFETLQQQNGPEGTDAMPLVLNGDYVTGWEQVFHVFYRPYVYLSTYNDNRCKTSFRDPLAPFELTFQESNALLELAHKYGMDGFERAATERLLKASTEDEYIELLTASQLIASKEMYAQAIKGLAPSWRTLTLEQAQQIGVKALFDLGRKFTANCKRCCSRPLIRRPVASDSGSSELESE